MHSAAVVDAHVHFWDPSRLDYPWLKSIPPLDRPFGPAEWQGATAGLPLRGMIFVECNPRPDQALREVEAVEAIAEEDPRLRGIVAFADLLDPALPEWLDRLRERPLVRGVRHNIQGNAPGFATAPAFVEGVREVGRRGLTFDLCATHDQLEEVVELARRCPDTRLILDHCGKPPIREGALEPWRRRIRELAGLPHLSCKLSGLLTEADPLGWGDLDLLPFATVVADEFGVNRLIYGGDWPVLTLAGTYGEWYQFTRRFALRWTDAERDAFYAGNALRIYGITLPHQDG